MIGSVKIELSTSTAPVPLAASPMVMLLNPSVSFVSSVSSTLKSPVPPPIPMVRAAVDGCSVNVLVPAMVPVRATSAAVIETAPPPVETALPAASCV